MAKRKLPWKTQEETRKRTRTDQPTAVNDSSAGPGESSNHQQSQHRAVTPNEARMAEGVSQADTLKKLAADLYGKIIQNDTFFEDRPTSKQDPVKNLKAAAPLFALQHENARGQLLAGAAGIDDDGMRARCLQEISVNGHYRDHIDSEDRELLEEAVNKLLDLQENDTIQLPDDCDLLNAYEQLRGINNEPSSVKGKSPDIRSNTPSTEELTKEVGEIVNADKLDFDKAGAAALSLKKAIDQVMARTAARSSLVTNREGARSGPEVIDLT